MSFSDPAGVHPPLGAYAHAIAVPAGARTLYISGQVGVRPDGSIGRSVIDQAEQAFRNLGGVLAASGFGFGDLVKLTTYIVHGESGADVFRVRRDHLGAHRPTATAVYVSQLFAPEWLVEIEAIAARQV